MWSNSGDVSGAKVADVPVMEILLLFLYVQLLNNKDGLGFPEWWLLLLGLTALSKRVKLE